MVTPKVPNPSHMLYELRQLRDKLDAAANEPEVGSTQYLAAVSEFSRLFQDLDDYLAHNGKLPYQWITKENQTQLGLDAVNAPHEYDDPNARPLGMATCGHREYADRHCAEILCSNYIQRFRDLT